VTVACRPDKQDKISLLFAGGRVASARHQNTAFEARVVSQRDGPEQDPKQTFGCTFARTNCRFEQTATSTRRPMLGRGRIGVLFPGVL
jgi:hypothetical protein